MGAREREQESEERKIKWDGVRADEIEGSLVQLDFCPMRSSAFLRCTVHLSIMSLNVSHNTTHHPTKNTKVANANYPSVPSSAKSRKNSISEAFYHYSWRFTIIFGSYGLRVACLEFYVKKKTWNSSGSNKLLFIANEGKILFLRQHWTLTCMSFIFTPEFIGSLLLTSIKKSITRSEIRVHNVIEVASVKEPPCNYNNPFNWHALYLHLPVHLKSLIKWKIKWWKSSNIWIFLNFAYISPALNMCEAFMKKCRSINKMVVLLTFNLKNKWKPCITTTKTTRIFCFQMNPWQAAKY